jgi:ATP adenylyltransferase
VFCQLFTGAATLEERHIVWEGPDAVVLLNAYPYASGHLLVMPRRHIGDLGELDDDESIALWEATRKAIKAIEQAYHPNGLNFGANLGRAAGAGIPRHVHIHVLPRWHGDTNFMTTIAATRVLPESLPDTWARVRAAWPS